MDIEIPDSFDNEWQAKMLRELMKRLQRLDDEGCVVSDGYIYLDEALKIVEALQDYSGY